MTRLLVGYRVFVLFLACFFVPEIYEYCSVFPRSSSQVLEGIELQSGRYSLLVEQRKFSV